MKRIFLLILMLFILFSSQAYSKVEECKSVFSLYRVDINIKNKRGWLRVCNNNRIGHYSAFTLSRKDKDFLCACIKSSNTKKYEDRSIGKMLNKKDVK